jgi:2'-5' RNA ligase
VRLFVAVEVGPPAEPAAGPGRRPAPEHLTLRFLGEVPRERLAEISSALADVARATPAFDLVLEGIGAFPTSRNPRVVWVAVGQGRTEASELAARVSAVLDPMFPSSPRESFVPHLTLFRVRSPSQRRRAEALLSGTEPPPAPRTVHVREIYLKESTLTPSGAQHRTLASWALTGRPSVPG